MNEFHRMKLELETTKEWVETCINEGKQRYTDIHTKTINESKKCKVYFLLLGRTYL